MTSQNKKSSTYTIIIIVLSIILIALLAFVFWQNFINNTEAITG